MRLALLATLLLVSGGASGEEAPRASAEESPFVRQDVTAVAEQLACYCGCPHMQVSTCFCGTADSIRQDIAQQLDAGRSAKQIIAAYVEQHGTWGLAVPPKEGFNLVIWLLPAALLIGGAALVFVLGARWSQPRRAGEAPPRVGDPLEPGQRDQLERLLREED